MVLRGRTAEHMISAEKCIFRMMGANGRRARNPKIELAADCCRQRASGLVRWLAHSACTSVCQAVTHSCGSFRGPIRRETKASYFLAREPACRCPLPPCRAHHDFSHHDTLLHNHAHRPAGFPDRPDLFFEDMTCVGLGRQTSGG